MGLGRFFTHTAKTIEKAWTGKPQSGGCFIPQTTQLRDEFAEAIQAVQQEIISLKQRLSSSSLSAAQVESQLSLYQNMLNRLQSDKDYIVLSEQ